MFKYELINFPKNLEKNEIQISQIFLFISEIIEKKQNGILNIIFVSNDEIKRFNNDFRNKNNETDVLSFHYFDDFTDLKNDDIAGEIVISNNKIFSQAKEFGIKNEEEFYKLLIHSILHIIGYDHETEKDFIEMHLFENKIANKIFNKTFF